MLFVEPVCFHNAAQLDTINREMCIIVLYPCSAPHLLVLGISPYCSLLQHILEARLEQKDNF
jgi:hypothetical protein